MLISVMINFAATLQQQQQVVAAGGRGRCCSLSWPRLQHVNVSGRSRGRGRVEEFTRGRRRLTVAFHVPIN